MKNSLDFACSKFPNFAKILSEMKKILTIIVAFAMGVGVANAAVRDGNPASRAIGSSSSNIQKRVSTTAKPDRATNPRETVLTPSRSAIKSRDAASRNTKTTVARTTTTDKKVIARATEENSTTETRTGAQYEVCKTAYFTCMDQFCSLKNDDYRRCSCSNRVDSLAASREVLTEAGEKLTVFTESLDTVGMTAAQATALRTASDGENALTSDTSASKALLQAIMNSIRGGDTTVGGKYSSLNSIDMSFDTSLSFGNDSSQIIASYNGQNLYSAVYPQCRNAVREDCNNASLQRAVTAYLMAIEQDCNTVQTAIEQKQREMKAAIREGSAMLDLARVENRQKHNSDDITTCINNVEAAILSEEVCGANYHKCLDNGEFIDVSTGAPITGVIKFYELGNLLKFNTGVDAALQKLSKISTNKTFVNNFEKRTKKFAKPALDKCTEIADEVWDEYLDKAMLSIYYAQQSKVSEIKQGCFDFVSKCYESSDASITSAMSQLLGSGIVLLQPDKIKLSTQLCTDYVDSCNNMFDGDIIKQYVEMRESEDVLSACRAVVKQCFDKYGGAGYENFYYPYSGLFDTGEAPDWFTLYDCTTTDCITNTSTEKKLKSPCAQQLYEIPSCRNTKDNNMLEKAFGGFDMFNTVTGNNDALEIVTNDPDSQVLYGLNYGTTQLRQRELRSVGVATEIYNQIIDTLTTQCMNINGRFMEVQFVQKGVYDSNNYCKWHDTSSEDSGEYYDLAQAYGIGSGENMCPRDYALSVDIKSWGACSCWGNGGRRSKNGRTATCVAELPTTGTVNDDEACKSDHTITTNINENTKWCTQRTDVTKRVCPSGYYWYWLPNTTDQSKYYCADDGQNTPLSYFQDLVPEGI